MKTIKHHLQRKKSRFNTAALISTFLQLFNLHQEAEQVLSGAAGPLCHNRRARVADDLLVQHSHGQAQLLQRLRCSELFHTSSPA
jgi:hypothetical protein